jgi:DNA polymerase elongation subunit (family B)
MKGYIFNWQNVNDEVHARILLEKDRALIRIQDYAFISYALLPRSIDWTKDKVDVLEENIQNYMSQKPEVGKYQTIFMKTKTLYGYQSNETKPVLLLLSESEKGIRSLASIFRKGFLTPFGNITSEILELDVSNGRKITAMKNLSLCPIIDLDPKDLKKPDTKVSNLEHEYIISHEDLKSISSFQENKIWKQNPYVLSFDLECYKDSERSGMPNPEDDEDYIFFASMIFKRLYEDDTIKKYQIVYGKIDDEAYINSFNGGLIQCETEKELLEQFFKIISDEQPELITGFNTHSWDWWYINERMKKYKMKWNENIGIYKKIKPKFDEKTWSSATFGHNVLKFPKIPGVIVFDIYRYFVFNKPKLQRHSLGFVSQYYLGRTKLPMSQERMVEAFEEFHHHGQLKALNDVAYYNLEDSQLVLDLMEKLDIFREVRNQSIIIETTIEDLFNKGMQNRAFSEIYAASKRKDYVVNRLEFGLPGLKGGFVLEPIKGIHENVAKLDLSSMYPNILKKYNICYSTYLTETQKNSMNPDEYHSVEYETDSGEVVPAYFVKEKILKGVTTEIVETQLSERKKIKDRLKEDNMDDLTRQILQDTSAALKLTTNSIIGLFGADEKFARLPFSVGFGVITALGRKLINEIIGFVEDNGFGKVLYGDTDSVFVKLNPTSKDIFVKAKNLANKINEKFRPFRIEIEDIGIALLLTKKRYSFWPLTREGQLAAEKEIIYKGTGIVRRNLCPFICDSLKRLNKLIFKGGTRENVLDLIIDDVTNIISENIPIDDLVFEVKYNDDTKTESYATHFAKSLMERGKDVKPGDILEYVVYKTPKTTTIGRRMMTPDEYIEQKTTVNNEDKKSLDEFYLLERLQTCVDEIYGALPKREEDLSIKGLETRPEICGSETPVKDIVKLLKQRKKENKLTLDELEKIREHRKQELQRKIDSGEKIPDEITHLIIKTD